MTEQEYGSLEDFKSLPLYDESDPGCDNITRPMSPSLAGTVHEATDLDEVDTYRNNPKCFPVGGICYHHNSGTTIYAYFHSRR